MPEGTVLGLYGQTLGQAEPPRQAVPWVAVSDTGQSSRDLRFHVTLAILVCLTATKSCWLLI